MKKCKNCSHVNEANAHTCSHCSMPGMFSEIREDKPVFKTTLKKVSDSCSNCGTQEPGEDTHCERCNFPMNHYKNLDSMDSKLKNTAL